jgi:ArsR family transcriptional regulator
MPPVELTPEQFQRIGRAISDPNRWQMLQCIFAQPETTCGAVAGPLPITAATASHHLRELEIAELVTVTRDGRYKKLTPRRDIWKAYLAHLRTL